MGTGCSVCGKKIAQYNKDADAFDRMCDECRDYVSTDKIIECPVCGKKGPTKFWNFSERVDGTLDFCCDNFDDSHEHEGCGSSFEIRTLDKEVEICS